MARTVAIGEQDFAKLIEQDYFYIDKTAFIKEWWENGDTVTMITRPRRFGKTLTMRMAEQFFSVKYAGREDLFENLKIWEEEKYRELQGTYPVIFLSFADVKESDYPQTRKKICSTVKELYHQYLFLLDGDLLSESEKRDFQSISPDMEDYEASGSVKALCRYISRYYKKKVIILLDEYDTPMQEAYINGFWDELISFIRSMLNSTFKTNPYLERGIMTGITRVSKESIFSDLNNLETAAVTSRKYETAFGFTEPEVLEALEEYQLSGRAGEVRRWYDGFRFGECGSIYNPWSITKFLDNREFKPYWANTSSNRLVAGLVRRGGIDIKLIMEGLLQGGSFYTPMDEEVVYADLDSKKSALWSLLLAGGYLKILRTAKNRRGKTEYELSLTNMESCFVFDEMVTGWFSSSRLSCSDFSDALLAGDKKHMNEYLNAIAMEMFSFFDTGMEPSGHRQPENFYHGFVLGMIADLREVYRITSNRESGNGRYDVLLEPRDPQADDGIIIEFKVLDPKREKSLEDTVQTAVRQILDKKYASGLEMKCSRDRIRVYGIAFRGKNILVDGGILSEIENETDNVMSGSWQRGSAWQEQ